MEKAATHTPCIVVGIDGSEQADAALAWAIKTARALHAEIVAVYAIDTPFFASVGFAALQPLQYDPMWRAQIEKEFVEDWCRPLKAAGVPFQLIVEEGRPALRIAAVAERLDADLVVTGRRGRGGMAEFLLGSTSHELTLHCRRPVVLISYARREADAEIPKALEAAAPAADVDPWVGHVVAP